MAPACVKIGPFKMIYTSMNFSSKCPSCNADMSIWSMMAAPTPWHLRCPKCRERYQLKGVSAWVILVVAIILGIALGLGIALVCRMLDVNIVYGLIAIVVLLVPIEFVMSLIMCNYASLEPVKKK